MRFPRRQFLYNAFAGGAALAAVSRNLAADPLGIPPGLELYTVRQDLEKDFHGVLKQVAEMGYKEVEPYNFLNKPATEWRAALNSLGLKMPAGHYRTTDLDDGWDQKIAYAKEVGIEYMVVSTPGIADAERLKRAGGQVTDLWKIMNLDDWKWVADQFNKGGERCAKAGVGFGYHNHNLEFKSSGGKLPYDLLLERTDPKLVKLEIDCGWMIHAGHDPLVYFKRYPGRFPILHVKDIKAGDSRSTDIDTNNLPFVVVGTGSVDWKKIFAAGKAAGVKHYFVEQDNAAPESLKAAKASYEYLHRLNV